MIGKFLSAVIKVATLPVDAAEIVLDVATAGDGSRKQLKSVMPMPSDVRDAIAKVAEEIDE